MKRMTRRLVLVLCSLSFSLHAQDSPDPAGNTGSQDTAAAQGDVQEYKYVTDKLRLSLYKRADAGSGTLKLLTSGDKLAVLERTGPYSRVRTDDGLTGWVKNGFLVSDPTASFQLIEEQEKNRILAQQIEKFADTKTLVADYENTIGQMAADSDKLRDEFELLNENMQEMQEQNVSLNEKLEAFQQEGISLVDVQKVIIHFWYFIAALLLFMVLVGFIAGRGFVEARVKRKFQGVKVW